MGGTERTDENQDKKSQAMKQKKKELAHNNPPKSLYTPDIYYILETSKKQQGFAFVTII